MLINANRYLSNFASRTYRKEIQGLCLGATLLWLSHMTQGRQAEYCVLVEKIIEQAHQLDVLIEQAKQKLKMRQSLGEAQIYLDILSLMDNMMLYHRPEQYSDLFGAIYNQNSIEELSSFQEGMAILHADLSIYNAHELADYLRLIQRLDQSQHQGSNLAFTLYSLNHVIGLFYSTSEGCWTLMNANAWPPLTTTDLNRISNQIIRSFVLGVNSNLEHVACEIKMLDIAKQTHPSQSFIDQLNRMNDSRNMVRDLRRMDSHANDLPYMAANFGDTQLLQKLAAHTVDLNRAHSSGFTPATLAAHRGQVEFLRLLAGFGVNLNLADAQGLTPATIAAQRCQVPVIRELSKLGVGLNQASKDGYIPATIAAELGHDQLIHELASLSTVDLNQADINGQTPATSAAAHGRDNIIYALKMQGANLNQANRLGLRPAVIAASKNHEKTLEALAKCGAFYFPIPNTRLVVSKEDNPLTWAKLHIALQHYEDVKGSKRKGFSMLGFGYSPPMLAFKNFLISHNGQIGGLSRSEMQELRSILTQAHLLTRVTKTKQIFSDILLMMNAYPDAASPILYPRNY